VVSDAVTGKVPVPLRRSGFTMRPPDSDGTARNYCRFPESRKVQSETSNAAIAAPHAPAAHEMSQREPKCENIFARAKAAKKNA
jgi:hypothetical protein